MEPLEKHDIQGMVLKGYARMMHTRYVVLRVGDAAGAKAGYVVPAASGAVAVAVGFLGYRRLRRPAPRRGGPHEHHSDREERHVA